MYTHTTVQGCRVYAGGLQMTVKRPLSLFEFLSKGVVHVIVFHYRPEGLTKFDVPLYTHTYSCRRSHNMHQSKYTKGILLSYSIHGIRDAERASDAFKVIMTSTINQNEVQPLQLISLIPFTQHTALLPFAPLTGPDGGGSRGSELRQIWFLPLPLPWYFWAFQGKQQFR